MNILCAQSSLYLLTQNPWILIGSRLWYITRSTTLLVIYPSSKPQIRATNISLSRMLLSGCALCSVCSLGKHPLNSGVPQARHYTLTKIIASIRRLHAPSAGDYWLNKYQSGLLLDQMSKCCTYTFWSVCESAYLHLYKHNIMTLGQVITQTPRNL